MRTRAASGAGYGAIGGAASAAFSPDFIKAIDPTDAVLDSGQQAALAGFATLLGGGLAGLVGANVQGAVTAAQNEALNNSGAPGHQGGVHLHFNPDGTESLSSEIEKDAVPIIPQGTPSVQDQENDNFAVGGRPFVGGLGSGAATSSSTALSTLAANNAAGKPAEGMAQAGLTSQEGIAVTSQVSLTSGSTRAVADLGVTGLPNATVQVPSGFVAEDINGNLLLNTNGNPITSFSLNSQGQAIVEIKTGGASLTSNQSIVYPAVQAGAATPVGGKATGTFGAPLPSTLSPTPVIVLRKQ